MEYLAVDYNGLAVLITAITGLIAGIGTVILQGISLSRQSKNAEKLDSLHECLHEQTRELKASIQKHKQ